MTNLCLLGSEKLRNYYAQSLRDCKRIISRAFVGALLAAPSRFGKLFIYRSLVEDWGKISQHHALFDFEVAVDEGSGESFGGCVDYQNAALCERAGCPLTIVEHLGRDRLLVGGIY